MLWLVRDRLGIKPLYVRADADAIFFASEVRALLAQERSQAALDGQALAQYMRWGAVQEPSTLIRGVRSLPAGGWMCVTARPRDQRGYLVAAPHPSRPRTAPRNRRWSGRFSSSPSANTCSVMCQWRASSCSGIDSTIISTLAARAGRMAGPRPTAFTVGNDDPAQDEVGVAAQVATAIGIPHQDPSTLAERRARCGGACRQGTGLPTQTG